jgi:uncharacterized protein (TIGR02996 family)
MASEEAFLAAIKDEPDEDAHRLVFADWLDEYGQPERAEFLRLQVEQARIEDEFLTEDRIEPRETELELRTQALARKHGKAWRGTVQRRLGTSFHRGTLTVSTDDLYLLRPSVRRWWEEYSPWVESLDLSLWADPPEPDRILRRLVAERALDPVSDLDLSAADVTAESLATLPALPTLRKLDLRESVLDEEDLERLAELTRLQSLNLLGSEFPAEAVVHLARMTGLRRLDLTETPACTADLEALSALPHLEELQVGQWGKPGPRPAVCAA